MPIPEILIMIVGMGDPESGDTDAWAQALFPGGSLVTTGDRKVMYTGAREIHLFEVIYEDSNEAIRQKFETLSHLLPSATPEQVKDSLEDYAYDVVENVLLRGALDAVVARGFGPPAVTAECSAPRLQVCWPGARTTSSRR